eukprot:Gb_18619 [translate_table: standard]
MDENAVIDAETESLMSKREDGNEWETYKENVKPLKGGRKVKLLNEALKAQQDNSFKQSLLDKRRKLIEDIDEYSGDDPLQPWIECIKWVRESFPSGGDQSGLLSIYEQCVRSFWNDKRYRDDFRYLKTWLEYADQCVDPEVVYSFLDVNDIGQDHSLFYTRYATCLELNNKLKKADEIYRLGIARRARPLEKLENAHRNFRARAIEAFKHKEEDLLTPGEENGSSRSFGTVMSGAADGTARQPQQSFQGARKKAKPLTERSGNQQLNVYNDATTELHSRPSSSFVIQEENNRGCRQTWLTLGTRAERNKENTSIPTKWTSNKIPQRTVARTTTPSLEVFVDEDCTMDNSTLDHESTKPIKALHLRRGNLQAVKRETELLKKNPLIYFPKDSLPR